MFRELVAGRESKKAAVERIRVELSKHSGRIDKAAKALRVSPRTLSRWLHDYGLQRFASGLRKKNNIPGPRP
jgi:transcriptional regulator with PAS, ATPase and Fis domain